MHNSHICKYGVADLYEWNLVSANGCGYVEVAVGMIFLFPNRFEAGLLECQDIGTIRVLFYPLGSSTYIIYALVDICTNIKKNINAICAMLRKD